MFHDRARIYVEGGRGGDGCVSFRREAHVPKGGPDGGDGGRGGSVVLVCDPSRRDLAALRRSPHFRAGRGAHGSGSQRHGRRGDDVEIPVPPGTQVVGLDGSSHDLTEPGQRAVVAIAGAGGHGNKRFATSTRRAPRFAERGLAGGSGWIDLRLKLMADAGLVGLPNAGKSSLLARLTRAAPKVAGYPFTTTEPVLGTLESDDRQLVLADIPGLIEGAAEGAGLGHEFLAHVERCRIVVHVVDIAPIEGDPAAAHGTVRAELGRYGGGLAGLPEVVVLSKRDLMDEARVEKAVAAWRRRLGVEVVGVLAVSAVTGAGLPELARAIAAAVPAGLPPSAPPPAGFAAEHRVYRPAEDRGFGVARVGEGAFRVEGRGVEMLVGRHDLSNPEALAYLEQRLAEIGVVSALRSAGFEPGDEVQIGSRSFELH